MSIRKPQVKLKQFNLKFMLNEFYEALNTAVSLKCYLLLKHNELDQLIRCSIDPSQYTDHYDFYLDYQCIKLTAKYPGFKTETNPLYEAMKQFLHGEEECQFTNHRLKFFHDISAYKPEDDRVADIFRNLPNEMNKVLNGLSGDCPVIGDLDCKFGPGASCSVKGDTSSYMKLRSKLHGTFVHNSKMMLELLASNPGWQNFGKLKKATGNELTFVPKDAKTDRPICIEPILNGFVQKGIGSCIRERLKENVKLDIRKGQSRNIYLASQAQKLGLATVDLKSASDTIAYMLVLHMLPEPWMDLLSSVRSPSVSYLDNNTKVRTKFELNKFSSMGNAYTFELETAMFYAIASATCKKLGLPTTHVSAYGDDIIIPSQAYDLLRKVLEFCGFTINQEKTYSHGSFYESCGKDFFNGNDVRPFFLKKRVKTLEERFHLVNGLKSVEQKLMDLNDNDSDTRRNHVSRLRILIDRCVDYIPRSLQFRVPPSFGDVGIHSSFDNAKPRRHHSWSGHVFYGLGNRVEKTIPEKKTIPESWHESDALYAAYVSEGSNNDQNPASLLRLKDRKLSAKDFWCLQKVLGVEWEEVPHNFVYINRADTAIGSEGYSHRLSRITSRKTKYFVADGLWS